MAAPASASASAAATTTTIGSIVPAQLGFLAIFNPSLGNTDETIDDQIVYYASVTTQSTSRRRRKRARARTRARPTDDISQAERHERLRQIGLAQGMVNFGRDFSDGAPVDAIDTEKSRVVAHELEPGWWILASVDLTKVPLPPRLPTKTNEKQEERYEYSSKEMKPAALLLRDLLRAHGIFLLHHDSSMSSLFDRCRRSKFVAILSRYWDLFLSTWSVMLHGNPARDVFGGINIAASGELGVGVGEEDRGSGEREVLEGLVERVEGLVDLVVSQFGGDEADRGEPEPWLGSGREPGAGDGAIFLGTGALSRTSLRDVTHWMEDLYTWGEHAYGVIESPTSVRRARARKASSKATERDDEGQKPKVDEPAQVAEPAEESRELANDQQPRPKDDDDDDTQGQAGKDAAEAGKLDKMVSYLTLGYGSYWSFPGTSGNSSPAESPNPQTPQLKPKPQPRGKERSPEARHKPRPSKSTPSYESGGRYLIGLKGEIEEDAPNDDVGSSQGSEDTDAEHNSRNALRTVHVEIERERSGKDVLQGGTVVEDPEQATSPSTEAPHAAEHMLLGSDSQHPKQTEKLRVVVYVNKPFIFTFIFRLQTDSLAWDALYRSLHYQLAPLRKPLLASTKYRPERPGAGPSAAAAASSSSIYDLVWDPPSLAVHSTIPNIPDPFFPAGNASSSPRAWSRADAVSTHLHLLNAHATTRPRPADVERTQKTNRGWWIVWTRVLPRQADPTAIAAAAAAVTSTTTTITAAQHDNLSTIRESVSAPSSSSSSSLASAAAASATTIDKAAAAAAAATLILPQPAAAATAAAAAAAAAGKEIILIRRASDHVGFRISSDDVASGGGAEGAGKLVQGIGFDTRRYVEELLTLL